MYKKIEATEIEGGLRLLPDEQIELAFKFEAADNKRRENDKLYFTNKRVIRLQGADYQSVPYGNIIYYAVGARGGDLSLSPGVTINLPGESHASRLRLTMDTKYLIDVEYLLARHVFKYC